MREAGDDSGPAVSLAEKAFNIATDLKANDSLWYMPYPSIRRLRSSYPLFARKFGATAAQALLQMLLRNDIDGAAFRIFNGKYLGEIEPEEIFSTVSISNEEGNHLPEAIEGAPDAVDGNQGDNSAKTGSMIALPENETQHGDVATTLQEGQNPPNGTGADALGETVQYLKPNSKDISELISMMDILNKTLAMHDFMNGHSSNQTAENQNAEEGIENSS